MLQRNLDDLISCTGPQLRLTHVVIRLSSSYLLLFSATAHQNHSSALAPVNEPPPKTVLHLLISFQRQYSLHHPDEIGEPDELDHHPEQPDQTPSDLLEAFMDNVDDHGWIRYELSRREGMSGGVCGNKREREDERAEDEGDGGIEEEG